jgi:hypothetical protein
MRRWRAGLPTSITRADATPGPKRSTRAVVAHQPCTQIELCSGVAGGRCCQGQPTEVHGVPKRTQGP